MLYTYLVSPGLKRVNTARFHLNSQRELLEVKAEKERRLNMLSDKFQKLENAITGTEELLFSKDGAEDFLKLLPQMIHQSGGVLVTMLPHNTESLSPGAASAQTLNQGVSQIGTGRAYMHMPVQIAIRGEYSEIISFFELLEKSKQLMTITELGISTAAKSPTEVNASLMLDLYIYENREI